MTEKDQKTMHLDAISAIENDDVLVSCTPESGCEVAISLGTEVIREIEKLEQYAALSGHRIGEFRVG